MHRFSRNVPALQWLDRRLGVPLCVALTLVRRLGSIWPTRPPAGDAGGVLFIKLAEQGSTVLAGDAIHQAVARVGRDAIYFLVFEENRAILDLLGWVPPENVFTIRTASFSTMVTSTLRALRQLRGRRLQACIDLEFFSRASAILGYLSGAATRVGFHTWFGDGPYRGDLLTHRVLYNPHLHTSAAFASLVAALDADPAAARLPALPVAGARPAVPPPAFRPTDTEREYIGALFEAQGWTSSGPVVLLNANAGDLLPLRKWDSRNYIILAQRLLAEFPEVRIVFTGDAAEAAAISSLATEVASPRCASWAGRTTLRQLLALYIAGDVLVTNDSGPAHFAVLTPIDTVTLFGPETPALFAAPGPRSHVLWAGLACSPCVNAFNNRQTACRNNLCMQALSVELVYTRVREVYTTRRASRA